MAVQGTRRWLGLAGFVVVPFVASWLGARTTDPSWYQALRQPAWAPPTWLFGPVWTVLYAAMGVAAWRIWVAGRGARGPLALWWVQLALNAAWSWIFFGMREMGLAFAEMVVLWVAIAATLAAFWRRDRLAGALLVPYLAWVTFAAVLNFTLWRMNG